MQLDIEPRMLGGHPVELGDRFGEAVTQDGPELLVLAHVMAVNQLDQPAGRTDQHLDVDRLTGDEALERLGHEDGPPAHDRVYGQKLFVHVRLPGPERGWSSHRGSLTSR